MTRVATSPPRVAGRTELSSPHGPCPYELCDSSGFYWVDGKGNRIPLDENGDPDWFDRCDVNEQLERKECVCLPQRIRMRKIEEAAQSIPRDLRRLAGFERNPVASMPAENLEPVKAWLADLDANMEDGAGLWLTSETAGTGKTTLIATVAMEAAKRGHVIGFWNFSYLLKRIRKTSYGDAATRDDIDWVDDLGNVDILILDDIGAEDETDWSINTVYDILRYREEHGERPVLVTGNVPVEQLEERITTRVVSRLYGLAGQPLEIVGPDYRRLPRDRGLRVVEVPLDSSEQRS